MAFSEASRPAIEQKISMELDDSSSEEYFSIASPTSNYDCRVMPLRSPRGHEELPFQRMSDDDEDENEVRSRRCRHRTRRLVEDEKDSLQRMRRLSVDEKRMLLPSTITQDNDSVIDDRTEDDVEELGERNSGVEYDSEDDIWFEQFESARSLMRQLVDHGFLLAWDAVSQGGNHAISELYDYVYDDLLEEFEESKAVTKIATMSALEAAVASRRSLESSWGDKTDIDMMETAACKLKERGILIGIARGCCWTCGQGKMELQMETRKKQKQIPQIRALIDSSLAKLVGDSTSRRSLVNLISDYHHVDRGYAYFHQGMLDEFWRSGENILNDGFNCTLRCFTPGSCSRETEHEDCEIDVPDVVPPKEFAVVEELAVLIAEELRAAGLTQVKIDKNLVIVKMRDYKRRAVFI